MNMLSEDFNKIQNEDNENKGKYYYKARFKYYAPYQSIFLNFNPMNMFNTASFERFIVDEENKSKIDNFLNTAETEYTIRKKERKQNITDNDCKIMKVQGTYRESYNNQISVDSKNTMIVANDVTNNSADYKMLKSILIQTINNSPENKKQKVIKAKYLNDAGYYSIDNLIWGNANGLDIYIPDSSNKDIFRNTDNLKRKKLSKTSK